MNIDDSNGLFGWKATGGPNFSLIAAFVGKLFESKIGKILLAADRRQFWPIFGKILSLITFEPYEERS